MKPFLGDRGVILLDGAEHRQRRQLLMPQFHGDKVQGYADAIQAITRNLIKEWQVGETLNFRAEMQKITMSSIDRAGIVGGMVTFARASGRLTPRAIAAP